MQVEFHGCWFGFFKLIDMYGKMKCSKAEMNSSFSFILRVFAERW